VKMFGMTLVALVGVLGWSSQAAAQTQGQPGPVEFTVTVTGDQPVRGSLDEHTLTFSGPVGLPHVTLPAGTYVFRFITPTVVQVLNNDRSEVYSSFFTMPVWRARATANGRAEFERVKDDAPLRLVQWFEADRRRGFEPYYGDAAALRMATATMPAASMSGSTGDTAR